MAIQYSALLAQLECETSSYDPAQEARMRLEAAEAIRDLSAQIAKSVKS